MISHNLGNSRSERIMAHQLTKLGFAALAAATLAACQPHTHASVPVATTYPTSTQQRMQAARHWEVLARDIAEQVAPRATGRRIYVVNRGPRSPFGDGFQSYLIEALVGKGVTTVATPDNALTLQYAVQMIGHPSTRPNGMNYTYYDPGRETDPTQTEVIVTTEIVNAGEYVFKTNDTYYVNTADSQHYVPPARKPVADAAAQRVRVAN
jgi:hypothetical protein